MIKTLSKNDRRIMSLDNQQKIVFKCEPLCLSVLGNFQDKICNYCLKSGEQHRCQNCKSYFYCGRECQIKDWVQHKNECNTLALINKHPIPSNILILMRLYINKIDISDFYISDSIYQQQYQESAVMLLNYLDKDFSKIGELIQFQIKIQLNSFTITNNYGESIAIGIYSPTNYLNHKCHGHSMYENVANCYPIYKGRTQYILTNKSFKQLNDQELCISYTQLEKGRQEFLQKNYGFTCQCGRCLSEIERQIKYYDEVEIYTQQYLTLLDQNNYNKALSTLDTLIKIMPKHYDDDRHPFIGWRLAEAGKLAFYCNELLKAERYCIQALDILKQIFQGSEEYEEIVIRLRDVQSEIKMTK